MTKLLDKAISAVSALPEERQDEIAQLILSETDGPYIPTPEEAAAIKRGLEAAEAGDFATEEEVAANFARLRSA